MSGQYRDGDGSYTVENPLNAAVNLLVVLLITLARA